MALICLLLLLPARAASPGEPHYMYLLVNPRAVATSEGVELAVGTATRLARPLLGESQPVDVDWGNVYPSVAVNEDGAYQLWWNG